MNSTGEQRRIVSSDNVFGPQVNTSLRPFDFTLFFEDCILSLVPSVILALLATPRIFYLYTKRRKVAWPSLEVVKRWALVLFCSFQVTVLALWALPSSPKSSISIVSAAFGILEAFSISYLSALEHNHSVRPSAILSVYLLFSTLFGVTRSRTLWLIGSDLKLNIVFTLSASLKAVLLVLESKEKHRHLHNDLVGYAAEATSGVYSRITFWWLNPLFLKGFRSTVSVGDLSLVSEQLQTRSPLPQMSTNITEDPSTALPKSSFIIKHTFKAAMKPLLLAIPPRIFLIGFTFSQPFLQTALINFLNEPTTSSTLNTGNGLIGAYLLVFLGIAVRIILNVYRLTTRIRGYLISTIYDAILDQECGNDDQQKAVTLMSTDVEQICFTLKNLHEIWASFLELCIAIYLLKRQMGIACIVPLVIVLVSWAGTYSLSEPLTRTQKSWIQATGARLECTNSMISHMEEVKQSGLTGVFSSTIQNLRNSEVTMAEKCRLLLSWTATLSTATMILTPFLTFAFYVIAANSENQQGQLEVAQAFSSLTIIGLLTSSMSSAIQATPKILATRSFFKRIEDFLQSPRRVDLRLTGSSSSSNFNTTTQASPDPQGHSYSTDIEMREYPAQRGDDNGNIITIQNGNFGYDIQKAPILRDINLQIKEGSITMITGRIGCGKSTLLKALLGETSLSTGRIQVKSSVAYCSQDPWLPNQSVLETITGVLALDERWFLEVVQACALTNDLRVFSHGRDTLIGTKGMNLSGGQRQRMALARAIYSRKKILLLDDIFSGMDDRTQQQIAQSLFGGKGLLRRLYVTSVLTTHQVNLLSFSDQTLEITERGAMIPNTDPNLLSSRHGYNGDHGQENNPEVASNEDQGAHTATPEQDNSNIPQHSKTTQIRDREVYRYYANNAGYRNTAIFLFFLGACQASNNFQSWWLKWWSQWQFASLTTSSYLGIYALISGCALISVFIAAWQLIVRMISHSGLGLHRSLLDTATQASISMFSITGIGEIGNRFSQDIQIVDMDFPTSAFNTASGSFSVVAKLLIIAIATTYMAAVVPVVLIVVFCVQKYYIRTSRQIRLLEIAAKSPLYTHFLETVEGILSIRAFGWTAKFRERNIEALKKSQAAYYTLLCVQCWLSVVLDLVMAFLAVLLAIIAVKTRGTTDAASIGVALTNVITFSQVLMNLVTSWTQMETSLAAIARIKAFADETKLEETVSEFTQLSPSWPPVGHIEIKNLTAKYEQSPTPVLRDISLTIPGSKKIGICGRSGSGKSSLLLCLLHLIEITNGSIEIDGLDLQYLRKEDIRQRLIVLPQHPLLLPGSVRFNIDPKARHADEAIIECLTKVQLWTTFSQNGGLDSKLDSTALSQGQKQLVCLARAMLCRDRRVLILDEATSSVDFETEKLMMRLIEEEFASRTVVFVTHRLHTIGGFDKVVVMDSGNILEVGNPQVLLSDRRSTFYSLFQKR